MTRDDVMTDISPVGRPHGGRRVLPGLGRAAVLAGAAALTALGGCSINDVLEVKDPDVANPQGTQTAQALPVVLAGALGDFHVAYGGPGNNNESSGQIGYSGLLTDEIRSSDTFPTRNEIDARHVQLTNASNEAEFINLSRARAAADRAALRFATFGPDSAGFSLVLSLSGFTSIMFAENYCSGVPFSTFTDDGKLEFGDPETTQQILQRAVAKFDSALNVSGATDDYRNLAAVGLGRALLDLGQFAEAAAAVENVPDDFVFLDESSENTPRENNGVWTFYQNVQRLTAVDREGENGLDYLSANDPRVPFLDTHQTGFDGGTNLVLQLKYPDRDSPLPIATGVEARLIEAEAALQAGDITLFLQKLNAARGQFPGLAALPSDSVPATFDGRVNLLFRERAFALWLTAHRLGDLRRLIRQYGRNAESVFPTGTWFKDGTSYGTDVNLPVPKVEENNPKFTGCLDRNA
jgi:tetratricopeptide (TPR) repeat protein